MKKNYIFIPLAIICLLAVAGCGVNNQVNNSDKNTGMQRNQEQPNNQNQLQKWQENFNSASSADIIVGEKIMVMGSENSDGTVSADRIIIGGDMNFGGFGNATSSRQRTENNTGTNNAFPQFSGNGARPNFQNMPDEERAKMREHTQAGGRTFESSGASAQAGGTRNSNGKKGGTKMARFNGEIISKDDISITLKLADGGSKLVFFSGSTAIMKAKKKSE